MRRRSEQQILGDADVRVERIPVEQLDVRLEALALHPFANPRACLQRHRGEPGIGLWIDGARETEQQDLPVHFDQAQRGERGLDELTRVGHAGGLEVDPVGADVERAVARRQRVANALLLDSSSALRRRQRAAPAGA